MGENLIFIGEAIALLGCLAAILLLLHDNASQRKRIEALEHQVTEQANTIDNILMERAI